MTDEERTALEDIAYLAKLIPSNRTYFSSEDDLKSLAKMVADLASHLIEIRGLLAGRAEGKR